MSLVGLTCAVYTSKIITIFYASTDDDSISANNSNSTVSSSGSLLNLCWLSLKLKQSFIYLHIMGAALENQFYSKCRISYELFMHLVALLESLLKHHDSKSMNSCG
jgi:hypothetical protein